MVMAAPSVSCRTLRGFGEAQVTQILSDRISRAFLLEAGAQEMMFDANARLVTELRVRHVWPARFRDPRVPEVVEDDGA
jgi:hypothetical protein